MPVPHCFVVDLGAMPDIEALYYWIEQVRIILKSCGLPEKDLAFRNFPVILLQHFGQSFGFPIRSYT